MVWSNTTQQYLQRLLNGGKGPLNRDVFEKSPQKNDDKSKGNGGGGKPQQKKPDLLSQTKAKAQQMGQNIKKSVEHEVDRAKKNPGMYAGMIVSGAAGFVPGAIGTLGAAGEAYLDAKMNGLSDAEARQQATTAGIIAGVGGKALNMAGKAVSKTGLGKAVTKEINKHIDNVKALTNGKQLAPAYAGVTTRQPNITNGLNLPPVKPKQQPHNIIAENLSSEKPNHVIRRNPNTNVDKIYQRTPEGKYMYRGEGSAEKMMQYRDKQLVNELKKYGYDMTPGGPFVDAEGRVLDNAWLTPEAKNFMPYLYDTDTYLHISPNEIPVGETFNPKMRTKNEAFWDDRGGDYGEGAYGTRLDKLREKNLETGEDVYDYNLNTYNRLHPLAYKSYYKAPAEKYLYKGGQSYYEQTPQVQNLLNIISKQRGYEPTDLVNRYSPQVQLDLERSITPHDINTIMDRRYGIPGNEGWGQTAIGNEGLNTKIIDSERVPVPNRAMRMADENFLDNSTGMVYNGITKRPQLTYPDNKPLIMDKDEINLLKGLGIKDISEMHNNTIRINQ